MLLDHKLGPLGHALDEGPQAAVAEFDDASAPGADQVVPVAGPRAHVPLAPIAQVHLPDELQVGEQL